MSIRDWPEGERPREKLLARGSGGILNISSVMGLMVGPGRSVYSASKHYVSALTEALRVELRGTGVVVSQVCPGPVESEFAAIAGSSNSRPGWLEIDAATCARESLGAGSLRAVPNASRFHRECGPSARETCGSSHFMRHDFRGASGETTGCVAPFRWSVPSPRRGRCTRPA